MTLAKTCLASNMMHDLDKSTYRVIATTKAFYITTVLPRKGLDCFFREILSHPVHSST